MKSQFFLQALASSGMALAAVNPIVKGTPQKLGIVMDPKLDRDSCGSVKLGQRAFWTCRDTQYFESNGSVNTTYLFSSSASWTNFTSSGKPATVSNVGYNNSAGLVAYGQNNGKPFFPILPQDCGDNTAGACSDGTRYAIWPDSPPMFAYTNSTDGSLVSYTWIRQEHITSTLGSLESDPPTTLYRVVYQPKSTPETSLPTVSIVAANFYAENQIAYGDYGNVVQNGTAYLFGHPSNGDVALARVNATAVESLSQYEYYVNGQWVKQAPAINASGINIPNASAGGQGTYYYSEPWKSFVWIGQGGESVSADFYITTAPAPQGPWTTPQHFYSAPNGNYSLGAYTLQAHPSLVESGANEIYLTYTKNDYINKTNVYTTPLIYVQWQ